MFSLAGSLGGQLNVHELTEDHTSAFPLLFLYDYIYDLLDTTLHNS
jgi:hypothetical protein